MTNLGNPELGNTQALTHMIDQMRKGILDIQHSGQEVNIGRKLGAGGTKTVYDTMVDQQPFALALPNTVDPVSKMVEKWKEVLKEPENTSRIRQLGILANPICELLPVTINGVSFPVLKMQRYEDLPFEVRDSKNLTSSIHRTSIVPSGGLNEENFRKLFQGIFQDLLILLRNGANVHQDGFNVCISEGIPRLYLNDLGNTEWNGTQSQFDCDYYAQAAIRAFIHALTEEEWQTNKAFFESMPKAETFGKELHEQLLVDEPHQ